MKLRNFWADVRMFLTHFNKFLLILKKKFKLLNQILQNILAKLFIAIIKKNNIIVIFKFFVKKILESLSKKLEISAKILKIRKIISNNFELFV